MHYKILGTLSLFTLPISMWAQEGVMDTIPQEQLSGVTVNALRVSHKAPFAFSDLRKKDIEKLNDGRDLPYLLDQTPSVLVNSDAGNGVGYTDIRVRGTDNSRINLTVNGIPVNDAESQGVFFVNFPDIASTTSSIQVQRGVGSSTNGSGAFGASINISNIEQEDVASATLINSVGSFGTLRHTLNAGTGRLNNGFNFDLRLSKIKSDGFIERSAADMKSFQFISGWTSKNEQTSLKFNLFSGVQKTGQAWNGVAESMLNSNRRFNELGIKEDGSFYKDQTDNYQQDYYQLFLNHRFNGNWKLNAGLFLTRGKGYYDEYRIGEKYRDYGLANPVVGNDTLTKTSLTRQLWLDNYYYGGIFNIQYAKNKTILNLGGAVTQYDGEHYGRVNWAANGGIPQAYQWYKLPAHKTDANVYLKAEQELADNLYATVDLQVRSVNYQINGFRKNQDVVQDNNFLFFNPKVGISYLHKNQKMYASFAIANKEPNRNDFEAGINDKPKAERLSDIELGYSYLKNGTEFGANLYYMHYKDQLILTGKINDVGAYTRANVPVSYRAGLELMARHRFSNWLSAHANTTFSQNKIQSFTEYIDDYDNGGQVEIAHKNTEIALSPSVIAVAGLSVNPFTLSRGHDLSFTLNGKYISRQYLDNTSDKSRSINPFALANFSVMYQSGFAALKDLKVIASVNNLLDKKYESKGYTFSYYEGGLQTFNYYFPQAGRNYNVTLILGF
ncbi:MAG: TonB-dependent receptor [Bacteroidetes bacterium 43-16]|nr:MAG: TonB-dependent receptor [Bacteroidetes bacterium 43-16]